MNAHEYLKKLLVEEYEVPEEKIRPEATFADLGLDSLMAVELVFQIEDDLGIEIPEEEADFDNLGEVVAKIDELLAAKEG